MAEDPNRASRRIHGIFRARYGMARAWGIIQEELQQEIEGDEYTISTYGGDTEEWKESNANLEEKARIK